ncbi:hypothetical protein [Tsukamurella ocularis]|uniref:hypothetical protein n=1 Tax=Tsukamurella ocularis TaxID=1970234 RepID=UPI0021680D55|nr:hypothetical protein [Tsukamurella ocularis]MCS3779418.1 hypothetical protein [Tsukamurella ocularis]MCS3789927.1 hypothetical protein [Tsukamurella ocularis]MCS3852424.1 hypothetical protein [Tsukamurella ocularis]
MAKKRDLERGDVVRVELRLSRVVADQLYRLAENERSTVTAVGERLIKAGLEAT